ncbi:MAG: hypothetical protein AAF244_00775 [Pseudomonadota bacterium]
MFKYSYEISLGVSGLAMSAVGIGGPLFVFSMLFERDDNAQELGLTASEYRSLKFEGDQKASIDTEIGGEEISLSLDFAREIVIQGDETKIAMPFDQSAAIIKPTMTRLCEIYKKAEQTSHTSFLVKFEELRAGAIKFGQARCEI